METDTDPVWANAVVIYNPLPELLRSPRHALHPELEKPLPLPCCRGEGSPSVVYPAVLSIKSIARQVGGTASYFLRTNDKPIAVKVRISVRGKDRYELDLQPGKGVVDEQEL